MDWSDCRPRSTRPRRIAPTVSAPGCAPALAVCRLCSSSPGSSRSSRAQVRMRRILSSRTNQMKQLLGACAAAMALTLGNSALANEKLAQASGCMTCHNVDKKIIGPTYKEVAAKYRGSKSAEADLVKKVKGGGQGVWGSVPMPPNAHVKDEDVKTLVVWILGMK